MGGQFLNTPRQDRDLNLGRAGVAFVGLILLDDLCLIVRLQCHAFVPAPPRDVCHTRLGGPTSSFSVRYECSPALVFIVSPARTRCARPSRVEVPACAEPAYRCLARVSTSA